MIRHLRGTVIEILADVAVVDVQGVGYEIFLSPSHLARLTSGQEQQFAIYTHVKEDSFHLFGFPNLADREFFVLLLSVSGVGPKTALLTLNHGHEAVVDAIRKSNLSFFQSIPRLGKKTAQKILVELQSKVGGEGAKIFTVPTPLARDVEDALIQMGYRSEDVSEVIAQLSADVTVPEGIKWALKQLSKRT